MNGETGEYRFNGLFDSAGPDGMLWIRSGNLTVQARIKKANLYLFSNTGKNTAVFDPGEVPEKIKWDRITSLTGEVSVFIGGPLVIKDDRPVFDSLPEASLLIIFYEGPEVDLPVRAVRAGRQRNEFINFLTPYSFIMGAFSQLMIAITYLSRPVYRMTLISSLIALFIPLLPWVPPGILFTIIYRRLWLQARIFRSSRDQACLPHAQFNEKYIKSYTIKAYILEIISWLFLLAGICVNVLFAIYILLQFSVQFFP